MTFRLGGGRSILLSYKGVYFIMHDSRIDPKNILFGGGRSILLSYKGVFEISGGWLLYPLCRWRHVTSYKGVWIVDSYITLWKS